MVNDDYSIFYQLLSKFLSKWSIAEMCRSSLVVAIGLSGWSTTYIHIYDIGYIPHIYSFMYGTVRPFSNFILKFPQTEKQRRPWWPMCHKRLVNRLWLLPWDLEISTFDDHCQIENMFLAWVENKFIGLVFDLEIQPHIMLSCIFMYLQHRWIHTIFDMWIWFQCIYRCSYLKIQVFQVFQVPLK